MSKWLKAVSTAMVGLLVATALAIGASAVLAAPASAMSCPNNGQSTLGWRQAQRHAIRPAMRFTARIWRRPTGTRAPAVAPACSSERDARLGGTSPRAE